MKRASQVATSPRPMPLSRKPDTANVNWMPLNDATNQFVHSEDGSAVHSVMVGGRMVVENRKPVGIDMAQLALRVEQARERLEGANLGNKQLYDRLASLVNAFCPGMARTPHHIDRFGGGHHDHQHGHARAPGATGARGPTHTR